ncbi:MAG: hypothetical protein IJQ82_11000 [Selenomonadaceae bacterium]|nr:hypothetical protein [Selenomonadaceae bacterium]
MIPLNGYDEVSAGYPPAGGYICKIQNAYIGSFQDGTKCLEVELDIAEGKFTGYFRRETNTFNKNRPDGGWTSNGKVRIPLQENGKVHWKLKRFLVNVEASNENFEVDPDKGFDERTLAGKICGGVIGLKEKVNEKRNNAVFTNAYFSYVISIGDVETGNFKIPDKKLADPTKISSPPKETTSIPDMPFDPDDVPF